MKRLTIDAPTLLRLVGERELNPSHQLVAPTSVRSGALDQMLLRVGRAELSAGAALEVHEQITRVKIRLLGDRVSRRKAWDLALRHGWTIFDAEFIAIAQLQADALVTVDPDMAEKAAGLVPLASLDDLRRA